MPVPGTYIRGLSGYQTFLPQPLPPALTITPALQRQIEQATYQLGQVEMCRTLLPNADLLIYSSLRREALASSTIEGTIASPDELLRFQISEYTERAAVREVANYAAALEWGAAQLPSLPIVARLILGLHERLLAGVRGAPSVGRWKDRQNYIGSDPREAITDAIFVPPPPEVIPELIGQLEHYINRENEQSRLVQCALTHYQFETIHPFSDGNGRVGRLLIVLQMIQLGLLSAPLIYPSVYFERHRETYYRCLQNVRDQGNWHDWIVFFVQGISQQCQETITFTSTILNLREELRERISDVRRRAAMQAVLDAFFHQPVQSLSEISTRANMAYNSVQLAIQQLEEMQIVDEITGNQRNRVYTCRPVLAAIFGGTPAH